MKTNKTQKLAKMCQNSAKKCFRVGYIGKPEIVKFQTFV